MTKCQVASPEESLWLSWR